MATVSGVSTPDDDDSQSNGQHQLSEQPASRSVEPTIKMVRLNLIGFMGLKRSLMRDANNTPDAVDLATMPGIWRMVGTAL